MTKRAEKKILRPKSGPPKSIAIKPIENFKLPPSHSSKARVYMVGDSLCVVDVSDVLGWYLTIQNHRRSPSMEEIMAARRAFVPPGLQMGVIVPPYSGHPEEGRSYVQVVQIEIPRVIEFEKDPYKVGGGP